MKFSNNAMSAILLCSYIGIQDSSTMKPLSLGEWNHFLDKLIEKEQEPSIVLEHDLTTLKQMQLPDEFVERVHQLVSRGAGIALELDDLSKKGISIVTQFDSDYPVLMRRRLKKKTPPVLFYAGDIRLAKKIGIAVVGSRNVDDDGVEFTKKLVEKAAEEKLIIYSGGAKGVDMISERTAINAGSAVVCFLADSLLSKIKKKETIDSIICGKLLLISDVKPDAGFSSARAMNRNKYIYTSAYGAFVVASDYNKGGTWSGAVEAMRNGWSKTLVWNHKEYAGNQKLIEKGGIAYELSADKIYDVITRKEETFSQLELFDENQLEAEDKQDIRSGKKSEVDGETSDLYNYVKNYITIHLTGGMNIDEASKYFNVAKEQMTLWLKRLCEEQLVENEKERFFPKPVDTA